MSVGNINRSWRFARYGNIRFLNSEQKEFIMDIICETNNMLDGDITENFKTIINDKHHTVIVLNRFTIDIYNPSSLPYVLICVGDENADGFCDENYEKMVGEYTSRRRSFRTKSARF